MAEEFVGMTQFGEYVKRIDDRFKAVDDRFDAVDRALQHANQLAEQRYDQLNQLLADADKAREQNLVQIGQRFDDLKGDIRDIKADMRQMRGWLISLFGLVVFGFIGSIVLMMLRDVIQ